MHGHDQHCHCGSRHSQLLSGDALTSSLHGIVLWSSYVDLILSHTPISFPMPTYLCLILSLFHSVLRCSIRSFVVLIAAIVTGRL